MRQTTFEETTTRESESAMRDVRAGVTASRSSDALAARPVVSSASKTRLAAWLAERRAFEERVERMQAYLATPEGQRWVSDAAAELRACPECHKGVRA